MGQVMTVSKTDVTKTGKARVYFNGKTAWKDAYYCLKVGAPVVGQTIEVDASSKTFENGNVVWFINNWKPAKTEDVKESQIATKVNGKGWNIDPGDLSRLASNLMASAIAAGLVKEPRELMIWAAGAYRAAESLRSGKVEDFNDEMITITGPEPRYPDPAERQGFDDDCRFDGDPGPGYTDNPAADDIPF